LNKDYLNLENIPTSIITTYQLSEAIKNGKFQSDSLYDLVLNQEEFINFITGRNMKSLLYRDASLDDKRAYLEEYSNVPN